MTKQVFVNPETVAKIDRKVEKLLERYPDTSMQEFQAFEMLAAIETGYASEVFMRRGTIVCDGWNAYKNYDDGSDPDPYNAWGGFYRTDKGSMAGNIINLYRHYLQEKDAQEAADAANNSASRMGVLNLRFEPAPMVYGYITNEYFMSEDSANLALRLHGYDPGFKRGEVTYNEYSGHYVVRVETTVKPHNNATRTRIIK